MGFEGTTGLFAALAKVGSVAAVRQEYQVYRTAAGDFVVLSPSSRGSTSFHMTVVPSRDVQALADALDEGGRTTGSLVESPVLEQVFGSRSKAARRYDILMGLYVLVAQGKAEMKKSGRSLVFSPRTKG